MKNDFRRRRLASPLTRTVQNVTDEPCGLCARLTLGGGARMGEDRRAAWGGGRGTGRWHCAPAVIDQGHFRCPWLAPAGAQCHRPMPRPPP